MKGPTLEHLAGQLARGKHVLVDIVDALTREDDPRAIILSKRIEDVMEEIALGIHGDGAGVIAAYQALNLFALRLMAPQCLGIAERMRRDANTVQR